MHSLRAREREKEFHQRALNNTQRESLLVRLKSEKKIFLSEATRVRYKKKKKEIMSQFKREHSAGASSRRIVFLSTVLKKKETKSCRRRARGVLARARRV